MNMLTKLMFALVLASACFAQQVEPAKQSDEPPLISMSQEEALQFWGWVANQAINFVSGNDEFKNVPQQTVGRLQWLVNKQNDGLTFNLQSGRLPKEQVHILMLLSFKGSDPVVDVNLSLLTVMHWEKYKSKTPIDRKSRNTLILAFAHEAIHLKHGPFVMYAEQSDMQLREFEERRTWAQSVLEDIRPMLDKGEPMDDDFVQADKLLRSCNDDMDCPAFKKFTFDRTGKGK
jgi:hypothetical protein